MHTSLLAYESVFAASLVFMNLGIGAGILTAAGLRPRHTWWLVLGLLSLAVYFGLLTMTTGAAPAISRTDLVVPIRLLLLFVVACMTAWGICVVYSIVNIHNKPNRSTLIRGLVFLMMALMVLL